MGCGSSSALAEKMTAGNQHEPYDDDILTTFKDMEGADAEIVTKFDQAKAILEKLEVYRDHMVEKKETLAYSTAAIVYKAKPGLEACVNSFTWLLAKNSNGKLESYDLKWNKEDPYFQITSTNDHENKVATEINEYIKTHYSYKDEYETTTKKYLEIYDDFKANEAAYKEKALSSAPDDKKEALGKNYDENVKLIYVVKDDKVLENMDRIFNEECTFIAKNQESIFDSEYFQKANEIGNKFQNCKDEFEIAREQAKADGNQIKNDISDLKSAFLDRLNNRKAEKEKQNEERKKRLGIS